VSTINTEESALQRLSELGKSIERKGFNFNDLHEACILYWDLELGDRITFDPNNVQFTEPGTIASLVKERENREFKRIHAALPEDVRSGVDIGDLVNASRLGVRGFYELWNAVNITVGHYNEVKDVCYVADPMPSLEGISPDKHKTCIAAHELGHRFLHKKRFEKGLNGIPDATLEEQFCTRLETLFSSYVFVPATRKNTLENLKARRKTILPLLQSLLDPCKMAEYTREVIDFYSEAVGK